MTVRELIALLEKCPQEQKVYLEGDETGDFPVIEVEKNQRLRFTDGPKIKVTMIRAGDNDGDNDC